MVRRASRSAALEGLCDMEGKSGNSRSHPIEQETQLALQWLVESPFYATGYKDYRTRLHATSSQSISHTGNEARGNPHNNMGNSPSNDRARANEPEEDNAGPALHLTPTCLP